MNDIIIPIIGTAAGWICLNVGIMTGDNLALLLGAAAMTSFFALFWLSFWGFGERRAGELREQGVDV